jgi:hypothetical protein
MRINNVLARSLRPSLTVFIFVAVAVTLSSRISSAQTDTWTGGSGNWSIAANWSLGQVPSPSNDCDIPGGSMPTVDIGGTCQNLTLASGSTINMNPGYLDIYGTGIANSGTISIGGTPLNVGGNNGNTVTLTAGCLSLAAPTTLEGSGVVTMTSTNCFLGSASTDTLTNKSTIEGAGSIGDSNPMGITNAGTIIANQSAPLIIVPDPVLGFSNTGTLTVNSGSTMNINGPFKNFTNGILARGVYSLAGTLEFPNAAIKTNATNLTLTGAAAQILDNISGNNALKSLSSNSTAGVFSLQTGANVATTSKFTNKGKVTLGSGSSFGVRSYTQSANTTTVDGTLTVSTGLTVQGGSLLGKGNLGAAITSNGSITTGDSAASPGVLTVSGSYKQSATGVLNTPIAGTATGQYGQLAVANGVSLNGTLNLSLINGFVPTIGSNFTLVTGIAISGQFATVNGRSINSSEHFEVKYSGTAVSATVVPGP